MKDILVRSEEEKQLEPKKISPRIPQDKVKRRRHSDPQGMPSSVFVNYPVSLNLPALVPNPTSSTDELVPATSSSLNRNLPQIPSDSPIAASTLPIASPILSPPIAPVPTPILSKDEAENELEALTRHINPKSPIKKSIFKSAFYEKTDASFPSQHYHQQKVHHPLPAPPRLSKSSSENFSRVITASPPKLGNFIKRASNQAESFPISSAGNPAASPTSNSRRALSPTRLTGLPLRFSSPPPPEKSQTVPLSGASSIDDVSSHPIRKVSSLASVANAASSLFPILREKSPTTSPTTSQKKRRGSFNFAAFDATLASLKHRFLKRSSSNATPHFEIERRVSHSGSITSIYSDNSDLQRFYYEERHGSEAGDSSVYSDRDEEETEDIISELLIEEEEEVITFGTIDDIFKAISQVKFRRRRMKLFDALFLSASDFSDEISSEALTSFIIDYAEDTGQLETLEKWLVEFRGIDKLKLYDPSTSARVRELLDNFISYDDNVQRGNHRTDMQSLKNSKRLDFDHVSPSVPIRSEDQFEEELETDVESMVHLPHVSTSTHLQNIFDYESASSSSSSFIDPNDDDSECYEGGDGDNRLIAQRLLKHLNRSEKLNVLDLTTTNDWDHNFEEEIRGSLKRRKSEVVTHHRLLNIYEDTPHTLRRSNSLPGPLVWISSERMERSNSLNQERKREVSAASFSSFSRSFHSLNQNQEEEEETSVHQMLAYITVPPAPIERTSSIDRGSLTQGISSASTITNRRTLSIEESILVGGVETSSEDGVMSPRSYAETPTQQQVIHHSNPATFQLNSSEKKRKHSSHAKQQSASSISFFKAHTPRRSVVSSSFSSFFDFSESSFPYTLPERHNLHDIRKYEPRLLAEQLLTTMCRCCYFEITVHSLRTLKARKVNEYVQKLVRFFEVLSNWPVTEILNDCKRTASERIDDFGFFVNLARACREVGNYHAVFAIVGGLQSPLLNWVKDLAHRRDKHEFKALKRLVKADNNYRIYFADLSKRDPKKPCIPYLGLLNRTLLSLSQTSNVGRFCQRTHC